MKKILSLLIAFTLLGSSFSFAEASPEKFNINESLKQVIELDKMEKHNQEAVLKQYGIDVEKIKERAGRNTEVVYGDLVIEYPEVSSKMNSITNGFTATSKPPARIVKFETHYNTDWKKKNTSRYGLKHWVDVVWNIAIGTKTRHFWKAATIVGLNPSMFAAKYKKGDYLAEATQQVWYDKYIQVRPGKTWHPVVKAEKCTSTVFVHLRGSDGKGNPVNEYNSDTKVFYAPNYNDGEFLLDRAHYNYSRNGIVSIEVFAIE